MSGFPKIPLRDLCEKITDGTHHSPASFQQGAFKYITAKNIKPWGLDLTDLTYVNEGEHRAIYSRCDVRKNDVLYIKDGATTGVAVLNPLEEEFSLLSSVAVLRPSPAIKPKYLLYALQDPATKGKMMDGVAGVAITRLTLKKLNDAEIPVASLRCQERIVEKLDELLPDLDDGVTELKAATKKLVQYRQSLIKAAIEGSLTAEWRQQNLPGESGGQLLQRILVERRCRWEAKQLANFAEQRREPPKDWQLKYSAPIEPDLSHLSELPEGWAWATLDQLADIGTGVTPLRSAAKYFDLGTVPWVTSGALNNENVSQATELLTELALKECRLEIYPVGSLLVAMYGEGKTRGKCSELKIPATINQAIAALVLGPSLEANRCKPYVKAFLLGAYERMRQQASGGVQPNLNLKIIRSVTLPLPPINEQTALVSTLEAKLEALSHQQEVVNSALKQAFAQRRNILRAAFSGQLVPQDPTDEPASELLARIRAERLAQAAHAKPRKSRSAKPKNPISQPAVSPTPDLFADLASKHPA